MAAPPQRSFRGAAGPRSAAAPSRRVAGRPAAARQQVQKEQQRLAGPLRSAAGGYMEVRQQSAAVRRRSAAAPRSPEERQLRRSRHQQTGCPRPMNRGPIPSQSRSNPKYDANPTSPRRGRRTRACASYASRRPRRRVRATRDCPTRACTSRDVGRCRASLQGDSNHHRRAPPSHPANLPRHASLRRAIPHHHANPRRHVSPRPNRQVYHVWGMDDVGLFLSQRTGSG
jgi:hypothetical protein